LLIKLDSRGPAALSLAIDPLLYGNRSGVMRTTWRRRIADIHLPLALRQSAIRALQKDADRAVLSEWVKLCLSRQTPVRLRLAAARALAALHYQRPLPREKGGNVESRALSTRDVIQAILTVGRGNTSEILALCRSHLPVIQLIALRAIEKHTAMCRKLIDVDHGRVAARLLQEHPSSIRHAVTIIARRAAMRRSLPLLFHQLGDPRLYISDAARMALTHLAAIGHLRPLVISDAMHRVTHSAGAQSQMQSLLILGRLKVSPAIKPASQLLTDRSARVVLAAVITLRRLNAVQEGKAVYHLAVKILDHEFELKKQFMKALAKKRVPGVPVPAEGLVCHEFGEGELDASGWWRFWAFVKFADGRIAAGEAAKVHVWREGS
jgi:HEAT repeat protein